MIALTRQTLRAVRTRATGAATRCGLLQERTQDLVTAASECAMNAVQHAGGGTARIYASADSGKVQVWIQDEGQGIDFSSLPRATLEAGFSAGGEGIGHGFYLMLSVVDRLYLLTGPDGTTVILEQGSLKPDPTWLQSVR